MCILLIEDDLMLGRNIVRALRDAEMSVDWVRDGLSGNEAVQSDEHAPVLLDLGFRSREGRLNPQNLYRLPPSRAPV